jgi:putative aldouronate transport system substrate-binding protein
LNIKLGGLPLIKIRTALSVVMTTTLVVSILAACTNENAPQTKNEDAVQTKKEETQGESPVVFPLKERITLKYWSPLPANVASTVSNYGQTEYYKELEKRTNIHIEFIHPPVGQEKEAFNLMMAGRDLPDIIEYDFKSYSGGLVKAKEEGLIIPLNDKLKAYSPNLAKIMENPSISREVITPDGDILSYPYIRNDVESLVSTGPIVRKDWLDELGIKEPTTLDEWYAMLKQFKDKKSSKAPLTLMLSNLKNGSPFTGAFGIGYSYYADKDKIKFGPAEPAYKEFLTLFRKWFQEGLIDSEFALNNVKTFESKILNGESGAFIAANGGLERYLTQGKSKDPKYNVVGIQYPSKNTNEPVRFMSKAKAVGTGNNIIITTANKHVKESMALADYGYSKEGSLFYSYGIEGVTYNMVNGTPKFTDLIVKNPKGLSMTNSLIQYARGNNGGSYALDSKFFDQYWPLPQQQVSNKAWSKWLNENLSNDPEVKGSLTAEESNRIASKETEISTYVDEMFIKFVMGQEPIENYDKFVAQIKRMGIDDVLKMKQMQHDRYLTTK